MKRVILVVVLFPLLSLAALASGGHGIDMDHAAVDVSNKGSLQRGAKLFVNYCQGCHSANYSRYSQVGEDLELTTLQVEDNFIFTDSKIRDRMSNAMSERDALTWFGTKVPDLSLVARAKGADWIYNYLRTFYLDESRPLGVNNLVLPNASMPHVLWESQGWQKVVYKEGEKDAGGHPVVDKLELVEPGKLTPKEYDRAILDLTNFLVYLSEPAQLKRKQLGLWVFAFLVLFFVVAYLLKKEYWKDVH